MIVNMPVIWLTRSSSSSRVIPVKKCRSSMTLPLKNAAEPRLSAFLRGLTHHACRSQSWPRGPSTTSWQDWRFTALLGFFFPPLQNGWVSANHVGTYQRWYIGMVTNFVIPNGCINFNFWIQLKICSFQQANLSPAARYALHCAANVGLMVVWEGAWQTLEYWHQKRHFW